MTGIVRKLTENPVGKKGVQFSVDGPHPNTWKKLMSDPELAKYIATFAKLHRGYSEAHGTGDGGWVHKRPTIHTYAAHVAGKGPGLGIGPLMPDGNCWFGAIDLDRPDFGLAAEMMKLLPGVSFLERSRSGNAHVWVYFSEPIKAWVVRGILRETLAAVGEKSVEVFPKSDILYPGMVGNYINLPYFGDTRPIVAANYPEAGFIQLVGEVWPFAEFVDKAFADRNSPNEWQKRANWLGIPSPQERQQNEARQFGSAPELHRCAAYIIQHRYDRPIVEGHRAAVFFALSKMLSNWSEIDHDEALSMLALVNDASPDPIPSSELNRILFNAERGRFTSTSCDDPLVVEYSDPECPIVKGN